jgi:predicted transcriptional regulator
MADERDEALLTLTADIVAAHVANNSVAVSEMQGLIAKVHGALAGLGGTAAAPEPELKPAVSIRASIKPDYLVCLEDGKKLTMLKRYIGSRFDLTPAAYREKWGLPHDYPMVAPRYSEQRRQLAHQIGLGSKPGSKRAVTPPVSTASTTKKPRTSRPSRPVAEPATAPKAKARRRRAPTSAAK